jgi:hypothetical protein
MYLMEYSRVANFNIQNKFQGAFEGNKHMTYKRKKIEDASALSM